MRVRTPAGTLRPATILEPRCTSRLCVRPALGIYLDDALSQEPINMSSCMNPALTSTGGVQDLTATQACLRPQSQLSTRLLVKISKRPGAALSSWARASLSSKFLDIPVNISGKSEGHACHIRTVVGPRRSPLRRAPCNLLIWLTMLNTDCSSNAKCPPWRACDKHTSS